MNGRADPTPDAEYIAGAIPAELRGGAPRYETGYSRPGYERLWRDLGERLLRIGGRDVVARPHVSDIERLAARGALLTSAGVRLRRGGKPKDCHNNVRRLARVGDRRAYGMALSGPFWIEHSWLVAPDGHVIETTIKCEQYFGIVSRCPVRVEKKKAAMERRTP